MLTKEKRHEIVKKYGKKTADSGSPQVQIALLTERIKYISAHLKDHTKDYATQTGLLKLVSQRRRFLTYLKRTDLAGYEAIIKQLDLRK